MSLYLDMLTNPQIMFAVRQGPLRTVEWVVTATLRMESYKIKSFKASQVHLIDEATTSICGEQLEYTVEPVLTVTNERHCIRRSVRKVPPKFSMHYIHFYIVYNGLPVLHKAPASWSPSSIIIMAYNLSRNSHTKYG